MIMLTATVKWAEDNNVNNYLDFGLTERKDGYH